MMIEGIGHDEAEDRVAQVFQPFVIQTANTAMRKGLFQQLWIGKSVIELPAQVCSIGFQFEMSSMESSKVMTRERLPRMLRLSS